MEMHLVLSFEKIINELDSSFTHYCLTTKNQKHRLDKLMNKVFNYNFYNKKHQDKIVKLYVEAIFENEKDFEYKVTNFNNQKLYVLKFDNEKTPFF